MRILKPSPVDETTFDYLVRTNIRVLKINGRSERKAFIKAMYRDAQGNIRYASTTREVLTSEQDVADKVQRLMSLLKNYGKVDFLGYETELVEDEWVDAEDMGESEI